MQAAESACHRDYFYVGGTYVEDEEDPGQRVMQGQMYVEELRPINGVTRSLPLVFIHGRGQTGVVRFASGCDCDCHYYYWLAFVPYPYP